MSTHNKNSQTNVTSITYRNAIYQGYIDSLQQTRNNFGIIYVAKTHQFICCNNWHQDILEGQTLFFNQDQQYIYGTWINNLPQGFNVFRFSQTVFMANFNRGKLSKNSRILLIFQRYNIGLILIVKNQPQKLDDIEFQLFHKAQVYSSQDVNKLFTLCQFASEYFYQNQTLIKYLSLKLIKPALRNELNKTTAKLRLIHNQFYRFGYDQGLAIVFDQDFRRISVGCHSKNKLTSPGIQFSQNIQHFNKQQQQKGNKLDQAKIIKISSQQNNILKTAIKIQIQRQQNPNLNKNYKNNLLMGVNFCNKFYKNPSKLYSIYIQNIISHNQIKGLLAGSLTTRRLYEESLQFSKIQEIKANSISLQAIDRDIRKVPTISPITHQSNNKLSSSKLDKQKILSDRLRLQAIKKQIYDSLEKRKHSNDNKFIDSQYSRQLIHRQIVGGQYLYTPQREHWKSRSRKKIFQESQKNIKLLRDFTPSRSQANLTPFKTKMKNRIFNASSSKFSLNQQPKFSQQDNYGQTKAKYQNQNRRKNMTDYEQYENQQSYQDSNKYSSDKYEKQKEIKSFQQRKQRQSINRGQRQFIQERQNKEYGSRDQRLMKQENHVSFDDRKSIKDSFSRSSKQRFQSSKNFKYVPIDTNQQRQRKRSPHTVSLQQQNQSKRKNYKDSTQQTNNFTNFKSNEQKRITPKSRPYLQERQSKQYSNTQNNIQSITFNRLHDQNQHSINKNSKQYHVRVSQQRRQHQNKLSSQKQLQRINSSTNFNKKPVHNDESFKKDNQNQDFQSIPQFERTNKNSQLIDPHKRSSFKHSNQVYLDPFQHKYSPAKHNQSDNKSISQRTFQNSSNKSFSYTMLKDDNKQRVKQVSSSYKQKHRVKKQIQKSIQKSPDKHRCYGKNAHNPYLQCSSPNYAKQYLQQSSYNKNDNTFQSPYRISRNQNINPSRNVRSKLF